MSHWKARVSNILIGGGGLVGAVSLAWHLLDTKSPLSRGLSKLKSMPAPRCEYISRIGAEAKILSAVSDKSQFRSDKSYTIVYGQPGAGVSSVISRILSDKSGVLIVKMTKEDTIKHNTAKRICETAGIEHNISKRLCEAAGVLLPPLGIHDIANALGEAWELRGEDPMTVVLEVGYGCTDSGELLRLAMGLATTLAFSSNVIVVLSDATGIMNNPGDSRATFVQIGEMTRAEARALVDSRLSPGGLGKTLTDEEFDRVVTTIGTLPLTLSLLCRDMSEGGTLESSIASDLEFCRRRIAGFFHEPLLAAIRSSPTGTVPSSAFDHHEVQKAMVQCSGVIYKNKRHGTYQLASKGLETVNKEEA